MGIHDREYIRERPMSGGAGGIGRRGGLSLGMFSANTWLIIICVLIFVVDHSFDRRLVTGAFKPIDEGIQLPETAHVDLERGVLRTDVFRSGVPAAPVLDQRGGSLIGWVEIYPLHPIAAYLHFSTQRGFLEFEFWRLIGFQFLHANFPHLLFNMIGLFFFGPMVEQYLGSKRYLAFYLLCGICGALMYVLLNLGGWAALMLFGAEMTIPGLLFNSPYTPLIGASAGVFGVLMAGAYLAPHATVLLFFILPMKLRTLAYGLVAFALFMVITGGPNAGGEAGHLGGALAGFYLIRRPHHLHGFFDLLGRADPTSHHYRKKSRGTWFGRGEHSREEIDRILDKISRDGLHSLSDREKRILREASDRGR